MEEKDIQKIVDEVVGGGGDNAGDNPGSGSVAGGGDNVSNVDTNELFKKYGDIILKHEVGWVVDKLKEAEGDDSVLVELYSKVTGRSEDEVYDRLDGLDGKALESERKKMLAKINKFVDSKRQEISLLFASGVGNSNNNVVDREANEVLEGLRSGEIKVMGVDMSDVFKNLKLENSFDDDKKATLARMAIASVPAAFDEFVRRLVSSKAKAIAEEVKRRMANAGAPGGSSAVSGGSAGPVNNPVEDYFRRNASLYSVR